MRLALPALLLLLIAPAYASDFWSHWGDGKGEIDTYRLTEPRYGQPRQGQAVLIFVTETHSATQQVKIEGDASRVPEGARFPVLKLNFIRTFQTGVYDYKIMTSVFARVNERFAPSKIVTSVQEWCGQVYHALRMRNGKVEETLHSYFGPDASDVEKGGEGDQANTYDLPKDAVFEDNLPILIRELSGPWLEAGASKQVVLAPSLLMLRFQHKPFAWQSARITKFRAPETVSCALGNFAAVHWRIVTPLQGTMDYWVEAAEPRRILKWSTANGESAEILKSKRLAYWKLHGNGDERYLK